VGQPIVYIDRSTIRPGKADQVRAGITRLVEFIEDREPQLAGYEFYFDEAAHRMTVIAIHPDSESLETHMEVGREAFRSFAELIDLESIQVFGRPSERVLGQLEDKAAMLGDRAQVEVHTRQDGFMRLAAMDPARSD
jgi:quinol monooxygenase YgiN